MHHKRRRRKKGGHKGHCGMCSLRTTDGRRNGRVMTRSEQEFVISMLEQLDGVSVESRPRRPAQHGYYTGNRMPPVEVLGIVRHIAHYGETQKDQQRG